jgi:hypothetical protein
LFDGATGELERELALPFANPRLTLAADGTLYVAAHSSPQVFALSITNESTNWVFDSRSHG